MLGAEALGLYTLAFRLPQVAIIGVFGVLSAVAFPAFSRVRSEPARLRRGFVTGLRLQSAYGVAAGVGLFMVAPMVVPVLFGSNWDGAIVPMQALALYAAARSLGAGAVDVYRGIGRPGIGLTIALIRLALLVPALLIAAHEGGIDAVAWTQAALALAFAVGMQIVAARVVGICRARPDRGTAAGGRARRRGHARRRRDPVGPGRRRRAEADRGVGGGSGRRDDRAVAVRRRLPARHARAARHRAGALVIRAALERLTEAGIRFVVRGPVEPPPGGDVDILVRVRERGRGRPRARGGRAGTVSPPPAIPGMTSISRSSTAVGSSSTSTSCRTTGT